MRMLTAIWKRRKIETPPAWNPQRPNEGSLTRSNTLSGLPYILPSEKEFSGERDRLDFQHHALRQLLQGNYLAPIESTIQDILDVGYGTGRWVREMAESFPHAKVIGIDIQATPRLEADPRNCSFVQGNVLHGLPFPSHSFGLTHQRLLSGAIPATHWPSHIDELIRVTALNGWVDILEAGTDYQRINPATEQLLAWWHKAAPKAGFDLSLIPRLGDLLEQHGLSNVEVHSLPAPLGKWGGRAGELLAMDMESLFQRLKGFYQTYAHVSSDEYDHVIKQLRPEWEIYHTQYTFHTLIGQKKW